MRYARLYADGQGESHFEDVAVEFAPADYAPPEAPVDISDMAPAEHLGFLLFPPGWRGAFHVAPSPMVWVVLAGEVEFRASDGETRRFTTGSVLSLEDTQGRGHATRVVGSSAARLAFAGLAEAA